MKKSKPLLALFMSAVMSVTVLSPDLFGNGTAKADDATNEVVISAADATSVDSIKTAVLKELVGTTNIADYDFYYDFSFDSLTIGSFSPAIIFDNQKVAESISNDSLVASINGLTDQAYDKLHSTFVSVANSNSSVASLADVYGTTSTDIANAILPEGSEGKQKLADFLTATYTTTFEGYTSEDDTDAIAYIPFTVNGTKGTKEINDLVGISLPAITAGTWDVTVVAKAEGSQPVTGVVTIEKNTSTISLAGVVNNGVVSYTGKGINVFNTNGADTLQVYVGLENCKNDSISALGSNADKVYVSIVLPDSIKYYSIVNNTKSSIYSESTEKLQEVLDTAPEEAIRDWFASDDVKVEEKVVDQIFDIINDTTLDETATTEKLTEIYNNGDISYDQAKALYNKYQDYTAMSKEDQEAYLASLKNGTTTVDTSNLTDAEKAALASASEKTASATDTTISIADTLVSNLNGKSLEDVCAIINNVYAGMGDTILAYVNSYSNGLGNVELKVNEYPSETGVYFAAAFTFDKAYTNSYETALYYINGANVADYEVDFNTVAGNVNGVKTLYTSQDLGATSYVSGTSSATEVKVASYYIGKDLNGKGNADGNILTALDVVIAKTSNSTVKAKLQSLRDALASGNLPELSTTAYAKLVSIYGIDSDDDEAIAFYNEIMAEITAGNFDLSNYGIYTSEDEIKEIGTGKYLQISIEAADTSYIALPSYRVFTLVDDVVSLETPVVKNVSSLKKNQNTVYWGAVEGATGYNIYRRVKGQKWSRIAYVSGGDVESYVDETAETGVKYIYTVRAKAGTTLSAYEDGMAVLDIPEVTSTSANYSGKDYRITTKWTAVEDATGYAIYRRVAGSTWTYVGTVDADKTTFVDRDINRSKKYYYTVRAIRTNEGIKAYSYYNSGLYTLKAPKLINVTKVNATTNKFTWESISGATGYYVYRRAFGETTWTRVAILNGSKTTSYTDKDVKANTRYWYTVKAYRTVGDKKDYSFYNLGGLYSLQSPKVSSVTRNTATKNTIKWKAEPGATSYKVFRKATATGSWTYIGTTTDTKFVDTKAKKGIVYYYTVRAVRYRNDSYGWSWYQSGTPILKNPVAKVTAVSKGKNKITWSAVKNANSYYSIFRRTVGGKWKFIGKTTNLYGYDKTAKSGVKYQYAVRATRISSLGRDFSLYTAKTVKTK